MGTQRQHLSVACLWSCPSPGMLAVRRFASLSHSLGSRALWTRGSPCLGSHKGTVKKWTDKGFGFIQGEDGTEYFVHYSGINTDGFKSLAEGEAVEFDLGEDTRKGGHKACNVTGPNGAPVRGAPRQARDEW